MKRAILIYLMVFSAGICAAQDENAEFLSENPWGVFFKIYSLQELGWSRLPNQIGLSKVICQGKSELSFSLNLSAFIDNKGDYPKYNDYNYNLGFKLGYLKYCYSTNLGKNKSVSFGLLTRISGDYYEDVDQDGYDTSCAKWQTTNILNVYSTGLYEFLYISIPVFRRVTLSYEIGYGATYSFNRSIYKREYCPPNNVWNYRWRDENGRFSTTKATTALNLTYYFNRRHKTVPQ